IRIVTTAADHSSELVPHLLNDEILLVDANTEADPRARDLVGRELQPRTGLKIATSCSTAGRCRGRRGRSPSRGPEGAPPWCACSSSSKDGDIARGQHDDRNWKWVGPALVFDHHPSEISALATAEFARDDQVGLLKDSSARVRLGSLAVVIDVRDRESHTGG